MIRRPIAPGAPFPHGAIYAEVIQGHNVIRTTDVSGHRTIQHTPRSATISTIARAHRVVDSIITSELRRAR